MQKRPILTNRTALLINRSKVKREAMFLHDEAIAEVKDRLSLVKKSFTQTVIVTGQPSIWNVFSDVQIFPDDDTLELSEGKFDLIIHAMCLHWANDPVGQLIQMRRALKPDGFMLAVFLGGQTLAELRACMGQAETELRGGLSPRVLPMADIRDLGALLQRAGFALPVADTVKLTAEYDDTLSLMREVKDMGEGNALAVRDTSPLRRDVLARAAALYAENYPGQQKPIRTTFELMFLAGWAPSSNQQKPLRPGSAKTRLADVLGTQETKLSD